MMMLFQSIRLVLKSSAVALVLLPATLTAESNDLNAGIDRSGFDESVRPQDDLFDHVNGGWLKSSEIPADRARWGTFHALADNAQKDVQALIEEVSAQSDVDAGSAAQKIRDYYNSYMDTARADELGLTPLHGDLDQIRRAQTHKDINRLFGSLGRYGVNAPAGSFVFSDSKAPNTNVVFLSQAGLTLPDRDYYLKDDERFVEARQSFITYASALLFKAGFSDPARRAKALLALETQLAEAQWTREQNRDRVARYNPMSLDEIKELAPHYNWEAEFDAAEMPLRDKYIVSQPSYFEAMDDIFADTDVELWRDYLTMQTISAFAPVLSTELFTLNFEFFQKGLQGTEEPQPRWKRAVNSVNANVGELLGQLYVDRYFTPEAKAKMDEMIRNLIRAYEASIKELDWMSDDTRAQALEKLASFTPKIGYPDQWRDYSSLEVKAGDLVGNIRRAADFEYLRNINKLDRPVDKSEWFMTPQTVNAYYNPTWNEIVFPAAILKPPFFNVEADDAANYGGIGAVIGHEIGHGFDDQGRRSDGDGNLRDWWTEGDNTRFLERKNRLAEQYDGYVVIDGLTINGQFTAGENIGDLGGLEIAHRAYRLSLDGEEAPVIDGWTGDQRLFLAWGQIWRGKARPEEAKRLLTIDTHSPFKFRANGAAVNVDAFYDAFDVKEGDAMYLPPEERVKIW